MEQYLKEYSTPRGYEDFGDVANRMEKQYGLSMTDVQSPLLDLWYSPKRHNIIGRDGLTYVVFKESDVSSAFAHFISEGTPSSSMFTTGYVDGEFKMKVNW